MKSYSIWFYAADQKPIGGSQHEADSAGMALVVCEVWNAKFWPEIWAKIKAECVKIEIELVAK